MSYSLGNESQIKFGIYKIKENPQELFERLAKPKTLELEPRPTFLKVGAVSNIKGSAYMEYGNTKVMAQVEPPKEISKQNNRCGTLGVVICSVKYAPFANMDSEEIARRESFMSVALKKALEPVICRHEFANFQLEIKVLIIDDDGCALSTAINCCGVALIEGGIPTYDLITASTVCLLKKEEFVNPTADVEELILSLAGSSEKDADVEEHGVVVTASLSAVGQVSECFQKGYVLPETLERLCEHSLTINQRMLDTIRHALVNKVKKYIALQQQQQQNDEECMETTNK